MKPSSPHPVKLLSAAALPLLAFLSCSKENEFVQPPPPPVTVETPDTREVTIYKTAPATIEGLAEVDIRARVRGILESKHFEEGKPISKGDLLFKIEEEPFVAALQGAQANLANAKAAQGLAAAKLARLEKAGAGAVSELDVEIARAELDQAAAAVSQNEAIVADAKINLSYTKITAPTSGRMSESYVDIGNLVDGSQSTLLAHVTADEQIRAYFEVPEREMLSILQGKDGRTIKIEELNAVQLTLADGSVYPEEGRIDLLDSRVDPQTRTATVRAVFPNPNGTLRSGLFGTIGYPVTFPNENFPNSVLVPSASVLRDVAGEFVWVVDETDTVRRCGVEAKDTVIKPNDDPNAVDERQRLIVKGLEKTDRVITVGIQRARESAKVSPQTANAAGPSTPKEESAAPEAEN
ncbi:efflux RND transporter periplasmic adaptor subunit [Haloferula rosea]|uniref:Efflux RND transporter periplasmic adaptor subunit n=1 Tax=Haloferula rosea TaxID=490093 RepID=A0A934RE57_9BACT|nr:efflux RND transporter periplasmic adaptor subunit [Haloferula rosea]